MPVAVLRKELKPTRKLALAFFAPHHLPLAMVALAHRIEVKDPDVVAGNRVWVFSSASPNRLGQAAVQVADCDWEKGLVGYDWRRGPSLDQRVYRQDILTSDQVGALKDTGKSVWDWIVDASNELIDEEKLREAERMERELETSGAWRALYVAEISGILEQGDTLLTQYGNNYRVELISETVAPVVITSDIRVDMIVETGEVGPELGLFDITRYKRLVKLPDGRLATVRVIYVGPAE